VEGVVTPKKSKTRRIIAALFSKRNGKSLEKQRSSAIDSPFTFEKNSVNGIYA